MSFVFIICVDFVPLSTGGSGGSGWFVIPSRLRSHTRLASQHVS